MTADQPTPAETWCTTHGHPSGPHNCTAGSVREPTPAETPPKWTELSGIDPDYCGGACSVDFVRWQRDAARDEMEHERCADILFGLAPSGEEGGR